AGQNGPASRRKQQLAVPAEELLDRLVTEAGELLEEALGRVLAAFGMWVVRREGEDVLKVRPTIEVLVDSLEVERCDPNVAGEVLGRAHRHRARRGRREHLGPQVE